MPESKLEIQVLARNLAKEALKQAQDDLKGIGEAAKKSSEEGEKGSKKFGVSLTELKSGIDLAVGGLKTLAEVGKAAFDFAEAGAVVNQTTASFAGMGVSLDTLRAAARGTVDDMTLMSSTLTLVAGAGPAMQGALAEAAPKLLEMAKAANKLNPTLGDTTFLYQSIATAAKRQSVQIADNLGIVVNQAQAYETYATSVGKAVTELSAEEKQLAFLNALLESGNVLLEQAGNSTESAADGYARLKTEVANATADMQAAADTGLSPFINRTADFIEASRAVGTNMWSMAGSIQYVQTALTGTSATVAEYNARLEAQETAEKRNILTAQAYVAAYGTVKTETYASLDASNLYSQALAVSEAVSAAAAQKSYALAEAQRAAAQAAQEAQSAFLEGAAALGEYSTAQVAQQQIDALRVAMEQGKLAPEEFAAAQQNVLVGFGLLTDAEIAAQSRLDALTQLYTSGAITAQEYATQSLVTKQALDTVTAAESAAAQKAAELADKNTTAKQKAAELAAQLETAKGTLYSTSGSLGSVANAAATASGEVETLRQKIAMLQDKIVTVTYKTIGQQEGNYTNAQMNEAVEQSKKNAGYAVGGLVPRTQMALVGERGPELVALPGGARVFNAQDTRRMQQGGDIVVNAPVTIQASINNALDIATVADQVSREIGRRVRQYTR